MIISLPNYHYVRLDVRLIEQLPVSQCQFGHNDSNEDIKCLHISFCGISVVLLQKERRVQFLNEKSYQHYAIFTGN